MHARLIIGATLLFVAAPAFAQTSQTWVSGVGDDANPCSRTAPCATFAGAYALTAAGGEINALDPGDFGTLTIGKAIVIDGHCGALNARVDASLGPIVVNAGAADVVVLRGLSITGGGLGSSGIRFAAGGLLTVEDSALENFTGNAIDFSPATGAALFVQDVVIRENGGAGVSLSAGGATTSTAVISGGTSEANAIGYQIGAGGKATIYNGSVWGNHTAGVSAGGAGGASDVNLEDVAIANNPVALLASSSSVIRLSDVNIGLGAGGSCAQVSGAASVQSFQNGGVACPTCAIATSTVAGAVAGAVYPPLPFAVSDAIGTLQWTETGALPSGLTFTSGVIAGTPIVKGSFPITVAATNGGDCSVSGDYTLVVDCPISSVTPASAPDATTGVAYGPITFTQSGAVGAVTFALSGTLPIGLTFNSGVLSGTPTEPGSFPLTITATDAAGCSAVASPTLTVTASSSFQATTLAVTSAANPSTYKQSVALTATVAGGTGTPTGSVSFYDGATLLGSPATLSGRTASINAVFGTLGSHSLNATYSGDATFGGSRASLTQTVNPAATTVALTSSSASGADAGNSITFTAAVTSAVGTPDGSVEFFDGTTSLGAVTLNASGSAAVTTSALAAADHSIKANYQGSTNFAASTATITQTVRPASFTVAASAATATVKSGAPASYALAITVNGQLAGPITFACSGLPSGLQCSFNPSSATTSTTVTLTVSGTAVSVRYPTGREGTPLASVVFLPCVLLGGLLARRRFKMGILACFALLTLTLTSASCSKTKPPKTYNFTAVASSGTIQQTTALQLIVQ